jgi:hypothetical protein
MHAKVIVGCVVLALIVIPAVALFPDFLRYMKMRAM